MANAIPAALEHLIETHDDVLNDRSFGRAIATDLRAAGVQFVIDDVARQAASITRRNVAAVTAGMAAR